MSSKEKAKHSASSSPAGRSKESKAYAKTFEVDGETFELTPPSVRELRENERRVADADARRIRRFAEGEVEDCFRCGKHALTGKTSLSEVRTSGNQVITYRNLAGAECASCGARYLEPWELARIDRETSSGVRPDYEGKVSRIGREGTVGTYWPKDVARVLDLQPDMAVFIHVLPDGTAILRFRKQRSRRSKKKAKAPA
ncbi:MAG: hypothetical protein ACYDDF_07165 [Thermoplasmatota archaeon]